MLLALLQTGVSARDQGLTALLPALVSADLLQAKLTETEADPTVASEAKGRLVALYRKALSNLQEVNGRSRSATSSRSATPIES